LYKVVRPDELRLGRHKVREYADNWLRRAQEMREIGVERVRESLVLAQLTTPFMIVRASVQME